MPRAKQDLQKVNVNLPPSYISAMKQVAKATNRTMTDCMRIAVEDFLKGGKARELLTGHAPPPVESAAAE